MIESNNIPFLCLNMIVKNESHIIKTTLEKIVKNTQIDYWVISDTGSTDGTQDIIKDFFKEKNIPGELYEDTWQDFGYNRTKALEYAYDKSKFLLIFDADDSINNKLIIPDNENEVDGYYLRLKNNSNEFERVLVVKNNIRWRFKGVLHEYLEACDKKCNFKKINCVINVATSGNRSNNPDKYKNDAILLEAAYYKALENKDKLYIRYAFYCANSYLWASINDKAEIWYKKVLELDGWVQEKYISCLELSNIYKSQNRIEEHIFYLLKSYTYDKERVECISKLIEYYCSINEYKLAFNFYVLIKDYFEKEIENPLLFSNKLFSDTITYYFYLPYYVIICANWTGNHDVALKMFYIIFKMKPLIYNNFYIRALLYNSTLYTTQINNNSELLQLYNEYISFLKQHKINLYFDFNDRLKMLNINI